MNQLSEGLVHYDLYRAAILMEERGIKVYHLEVGDPYIDGKLSNILSDIISKHVAKGSLHYTIPEGLYSVREAIAKYMFKRLGVDIHPENIIITPGGKTALYLTLLMLIRDEGLKYVTVFEPTWSAYKHITKLVNGKYISIPLTMDQAWIPNHNTLNKLKNTNTHIFLLLNPNNPSGAVYPSNIIDQLYNTLANQSIIISDEIYFDTIHGNIKFTSMIKYGLKNILGIYSLSKILAIPGLRFGWVVLDEKYIKRIIKYIQLIYTSIPEFIQYAVIDILNEYNIIEKIKSIYAERVNYLASRLKKMGFSFLYPSSSFYIFSMLPREIKGNSISFCKKLLEKKHVAVAPGPSFGEDKYYNRFIRFSACRDIEYLETAMNLVEEFIEKEYDFN